MCAPCNGAKTPPRPMSRPISWRNWTSQRLRQRNRRQQKNERTHGDPHARRGIFRVHSICRFVVAAWARRNYRIGLVFDRRDRVTAAIQLFLVVRLYLFLHPLLWLPVL